MFPHKILIATSGYGGGKLRPTASRSTEPPVKVNVLNVCAPSAEEQKELSSALAKVPGKPAFAADYEVARGHSTLDPSTPIPGMQPLPPGAVSAADWVRVRREFPDAAPFSNVQYSFSVDAKNMVETLVLRVRDPKDRDGGCDRGQCFRSYFRDRDVIDEYAGFARQTGAFRKGVGGAGACAGEEGTPATDQSAYEPIFRAASSIMERYRDALGARKMVPQELARLGVGAAAGTPAKTGAGSKKTP